MNPMDDFSGLLASHFPRIKVATASDLSFVLHLQKRFSNQLGFLPKPAIEWYIEHQRCLLATENEAPAGYLLGRASMRYDRRIRPCTQVAVELDLRRSTIGMQLVRAHEWRAALDGLSMVQCWCAGDIEAMYFWAALGWSNIAERSPDNARGRTLYLWRHSLLAQPIEGFYAVPPVAGYRAAKSGTQQMMFPGGNSALIL